MFHSEIFEKMTLHAKKSLTEAESIAFYRKKKEILPFHLLMAIFLEEGSLGSNILKSMGLKRTIFNIALTDQKPKSANSKILPLSSELKKIVTRAYALANSFGYPYVGTEHLVYALVECKEASVQEIFKKAKIKNESFENLTKNSMDNDSLSEFSNSMPLPDVELAKNKKSFKAANPHLDQYCINLNDEVEKKDEKIVGRANEINRLIHILGRKNKNNPILIGDPGVGKTALISGLAQRINLGEVPYHLAEKSIYSLDMALVVAGTTFRGEFENRLKGIINEAKNNKNVILFIDEVHSIVGAGNSQGGLDAANILKPALSRGDIQCIGATTFSEYKKYVEKDPALARRFQPILISEPSIEETRDMMMKLKKKYEDYHHINISNEAIVSSVAYSFRYIQDRFMPDKAFDLLDEAASEIRNRSFSFDWLKKFKKIEKRYKDLSTKKEELVQKQQYEEAMKIQKQEIFAEKELKEFKKNESENEFKNKPTLTETDIAKTVSRMTGIPKEKLSPERRSAKIINIESRLNEKIIGQAEATKKIAEVLIRSYSGITNPDRPVGSFLFLGPTGVGKTLAAKVVGKEIFHGNSIIKIDMSEFAESHNIARLFGAPAGYVGFGEGGVLTEKVRHQPYSLVLFDEIEKAHPDVLNILLQILEDGNLTDAEGRKVNFKNTIIILTSNLGTSDFNSSAKVGFESSSNEKIKSEYQAIKDKALKTLSEHMKPEIINRLDQVIVFNPLSESDIEKVVSVELGALALRLKNQSINLKISDKLIKFLAKKSMAHEYGARLVRKNIQDMVENEIAKRLLANKTNSKTISLHVKGERIEAC